MALTATEIDDILSGRDWEEVSSVLQDTIKDLLELQSIHSSPPPDPDGLELEPEPSHSQVGGSGWCPHERAAHSMVTAPSMYSGQSHVGTMQPGQPGAYSQWPVGGVPILAAAAVSHPAASPPHTYNNIPVVRLPEGFDQNLQCLGMINGEPFYALAAGAFSPSAPAAPQPSTSNSNKRKSKSQQEDDRPYVKRPPNAFMLYMREHRPHVEEDVKRMGNSAVNTVLGQRWNSLSVKEQAVYYQQAQREKEFHAQQHPGWSVSQNYGKKRTKSRRAPKVSVSSAAAVLKDSTSQTDEEEPRQQTAVVQLLQ